MRHNGEWKCSSNHSLTSALDVGKWSDYRSGHFNLRKRALGTHRRGDWVGPRAVLDMVVKREIPNPRRESNLRTSIVRYVKILMQKIKLSLGFTYIDTDG
jgi:hypothetical protein